MMVLNIITTVFDAFLMAAVTSVALTSSEKKSFGVSAYILITLIMNLYCMWGRV